MKKILGLFLTVATAAVIATSCTKTCDPGYEGSKCTTEVRAKFYGSYKMSGTAVNPAGSIPISDLIVAVSGAASGVLDMNFTYTLLGDVYSLKGTLSADNTTFTIPSQTTNGLTYSGTGSFAGTTLNLSLTEADSGVNTVITLSGPLQ